MTLGEALKILLDFVKASRITESSNPGEVIRAVYVVEKFLEK